MLTHYVIYGLLGMLMEVFWTGLHSLLAKDYNLISMTSIWMFFIYGLAVFLEPVHNKIRRYHIIIRGVIWAFVIFTIEYISGFVLEQLVGSFPWDYRNSTMYTIRGYIRFDYFPAWFVVGLGFEKIHDFLKGNLKKIIKQ